MNKIEKKKVEIINEKRLNTYKFISYICNMVNKVIEGVNFREMPICDIYGNISRYEVLSFKKGIDTTDLMKEIDELGLKIHLFQSLFSKYLFILNADKNKNISINIGYKELLDDDLVEYIFTNNTFSSRTVLEVLEESFNGKDNEVYKNLVKLKNAGYDFALDDFGTGDCNIERVKKFSEKKLLGEKGGIKLDKSIYNSIDSYEKIFDTLRNKGINITGEWVVNEEIFKKIKSYGVNLFQGNYTAKMIESFKEIKNR